MIEFAFNGKPVKNRWSHEEIVMLRDLAGTMPIDDIANVLNRAVGGVLAKARSQGFELATVRKKK